MAFETASSQSEMSSSLLHLKRQLSPPIWCEVPPGEGGEEGVSKTTRRHSVRDSQLRVATAFSKGISAKRDNKVGCPRIS